MKLRVYLLVDSDGSVQARKSVPLPRLNHVAIQLLLDIDDKWFVHPIPSIEPSIPDSHVRPMVVVQSVPIDGDLQETS